MNFAYFTNEKSTSENYGYEPGLLRLFQIEYKGYNGRVYLGHPICVEENVEDYYEEYLELLRVLGELPDEFPTGRALFLGYYDANRFVSFGKSIPISMERYLAGHDFSPKEKINDHIPLYYNMSVRQSERELEEEVQDAEREY